MERFARYLDDAGMNCAGFARKLGVEDSTVWRWIHGEGKQRRSPTLALALRIERVTGGAVPASSWEKPSATASAVQAGKRKPPRGRRIVRRSSAARVVEGTSKRPE